MSKLPGWKLEVGKLHREYELADLVAAFGFMPGAALVAQGTDHHPETRLDLKLAHAMEEPADRQLEKGSGSNGSSP
ncbi:MAG: 4a-hydroxytetrahydrobiopterin dehydratase [Deltaproteobacteria bacterium]|nr:4a-hydroxytetrahydrobiopterin dehydratase [Deltaproteobacteria bacterium]